MSKTAPDIFGDLFGRQVPSLADAVAEKAKAEALAFVAQHGLDNLRKAMGLYNAAVKCLTAGGEVLFVDSSGAKKRWKFR